MLLHVLPCPEQQPTALPQVPAVPREGGAEGGIKDSSELCREFPLRYPIRPQQPQGVSGMNGLG